MKTYTKYLLLMALKILMQWSKHK